jgi:ADP-ribosyl-[dinitrogen reductase] hydrolase
LEVVELAHDLADSIRGGVWGLAAGDALGATLEFVPRDQVTRAYGRHTDMVGGGWLKLPPGACTDDTEMMLATAAGIAANPDDPLPGVGERLVRWYRSDPPDVGNIIRCALSLYLDTGCWERAGTLAEERFQPRAAGNGGLMRIAPVGLAYHRQAAPRDHWAAYLTAMTHSDQLCQLLSVAFCALVGSCTSDMPDRRSAYRSALAHGLEKHPLVEPGLIARLQAVEDLTYPQLQGTGYVLDCFEASAWCFLHRDTPEEAIVAAVNLGDDADTTGAVTGALVGAYYGYDALPRRWVERLLPGDRLDEAARGLLRVASR